MFKRLFSATMLLVVASLATAQAQTATPVVRAREQNQRARIRQGVASGELTPREAARLRGREAGLTAERRADRADGVVTAQERQDLRRTENRDSRAIYRQKHDGQVR
ncbi:hypothetical protein HHL22_11200 [Hymenobacter sp. RP-2-7]|uniref:DUF4148 domain-containing protein n=1 Tax=Hymenobacter polaris TaxID=2682546 RepID=A0A7Y0FME3_9BACT|nr:hypothetical protein [Hymenobacter polaris]NML65773.1 hypothetical protein [Hymenobacter polaris]